MTQGSLTKLLKKHCHQFNVTLVTHRWVGYAALTEYEQQLLPVESQYLLRQVILLGDNELWVLGQTVIPNSTIAEQTVELANLGETPLGEVIFGANCIHRDSLVLSTMCIGKKESCYARCSRLWLNHKPLVVTEIFLPDAPIYREGKPE